jgi:ribose transport system ATP-binding protein
VLAARGLRGRGVDGVDLELRTGEIVGLTGLAGAGASELLALLFGDAPITAGELRVDGRASGRWSRRAAMRAGLALVPADRRHQAIFPELSVRENLSAATVSRYWSGGRLAERRERRDAAADAGSYLVRAASLSQPIATLSGGNQQKVMLARWLRRAPRLLLLDEPTQGVDVGARRELWAIVRRAVDDGACALAASSDVEDLVGVCDRILVVRDGRIAHEVADGPLDAGRITQLLHGTA